MENGRSRIEDRKGLALTLALSRREREGVRETSTGCNHDMGTLELDFGRLRGFLIRAEGLPDAES